MKLIILHEAERVDGEGKVKGYITKMWGEYHIILEHDENTAYPVKEESILPCIAIRVDLGRELRKSFIND